MDNTNFDLLINRKGSDSVKYDKLKNYFGSDDLIPLWVADMDFTSPDFILDAIRSKCDHGVLGYSIIPERWNNAIKNWLIRKYDWKIENESIGFIPGIVSGISLVLQCFTKPGDKVLIQTPVYPPFMSIPKSNKRELVINQFIYNEGKLEIDFDDFEKKASSGCKLFILCSPHNPGGRVWTEEELNKMSKICKANNILIVSDEIHADLTLPAFKHIPLASINEDIANNVITLMAPSKTFNIPGLSSSFCVIKNKETRKTFMEHLELAELSNGNIFAVTAAIAAYENGYEWLESLKKYLQSNIDYVNKFLQENIPAIKVCIPQASFLIWLDCRDLKLNEKDLKDLFINKAGLALNPGTSFGPGGEGFMRLNIGCPKETLTLAMNKLKSAVVESF